jgi:hypothetical protein
VAALRIAHHRFYAQINPAPPSAARQVKDVLLAMLDPAAAARANAAAERAEQTARELGLEQEERQAIRTAAELYDIAGDPLIAARVLDAAPALAPAAALLRATVDSEGEMPLAARIVLDARLQAFAR